MLNMLFGEMTPGGVGTGLYSILVMAVIAMFLAGLMVGRTPEYLGKKLGRREVTAAAVSILAMPTVLLIGAGIAAILPGGTIAQREGVSEDRVPGDAYTASASGLDPDISPEYAELQVPRVARATGLPEQKIRELVAAHTDGRGLGVLDGIGVNVTALNRALEAAR